MNFCPRCAAALETQTLNELPRRVCSACGYIYWNNPLPVAGAAVIDGAGRILLARRGVEPRLGLWNLPSGYLEFGESIEEAAVREVREETGLEVVLNGFLLSAGAGHRLWPWSSVTFSFFYARPIGGLLRAGDDADQVRFFDPVDLPGQIAFPAHEKALAQWQRDRVRGRGEAWGVGPDVG